jgi:hypothetical protein
MPRDLGDVLHFFAPELTGSAAVPANGRDEALPLVGVPFANADPVRAALLWNLAVEAARQNARAVLLAPRSLCTTPVWPLPGRGPLGALSIRAEADAPAELARIAEEWVRGAAPRDRALALVALPASYLDKTADAEALLRWTLLLVRPHEAEANDTWTALEAIATHSRNARIGVTVFGVRSIVEARDCFEQLAAAAEQRLGCTLISYGLLVDDVHLSRSIVTGRPIALASAHATSARALADVAAMLLEDAHGAADG